MNVNENHITDKLVFDLDSSSSDHDESTGGDNDEKNWKNSLSNLSLSRSNSRSHLSNENASVNGKCRKSFCECCKQLYVKLGMKHVIPFFILLLYSAAGGAAFYFIESPLELERSVKRREILNYARRQVQERVWELHLEKNFTKIRIMRAAGEAIAWYENYTSAKTDVQSEYQWDLWGAIFYCGTIYTTIGYGNIAPVTVVGQVLTIFYSAFGIPLILFILNDMGEVIGKGAYRLWSFFNKNALKKNDKDKNNQQQQQQQQLKMKRNTSFNDSASVMGVESASIVHKLPMSVAFGITLAWMLICSAIFSIWENWSYFTAFYFFFISLTTIGLGDIVPHHHQFLIMNFGLVLLGLSLVSMCIQVVQAKVEYIAQQLLHRISKRYQNAQVEGGELSSIRADDELENTLNQIQQPSWLKALVSRKKKEKIINEYKKRTKMRAKYCQTEINWNDKHVGVQTDDTIDWRKHYERELVNVQQLVQQLEQIYDNQGMKNSLQDYHQEGQKHLVPLSNYNLLPQQQQQQQQQQQEKDNVISKKKKTGFDNILRNSFKKKSTEDNNVTETLPRKTDKRKSFHLAAFMNQALSKSPKKRLTPLEVLKKEVTITLNDQNETVNTDFDDLSSNTQITSTDDDDLQGSKTTISSMPDISNYSNDTNNAQQQCFITNIKTDSQNKSTLLDLPVIHYQYKNKTQDKSNNNYSLIEIQPVQPYTPVTHSTSRSTATGSNRLAYHESIKNLSSQQQNKPESSLLSLVTNNSKSNNNNNSNNSTSKKSDEKNNTTLLDLSRVENFLDNLHIIDTSSQVNTKDTTEKKIEEKDTDIEAFYKNKNQRFEYADGDLPVSSISAETYNVLPEIHRSVLVLPKNAATAVLPRNIVAPVSPKKDIVTAADDVVDLIQTKAAEKIRRLSWSPNRKEDIEEEDDREFSRKPYALDDCKLLFAEIKHRIKDCQHILTEQRISSGFNTPMSSSKSQ